jgi:nucleotidyltransferase AbiEii toxin of type IV toxin-antitoxin system
MANLAASVRARLLNLAKERGEDYSLVLNRFATERFLYRLSVTPQRERLWLKGALLFNLWFDVPHRPTRDADFLGFGPEDAKALEGAISEVCAVLVADGIQFDPSTIKIEPIRDDNRYGGLRARFVGYLEKTRCTVQIDVGYGDAVTPGPQDAEYPTLLDDFPAPKLHVYPRETVVAEKLEAIVSLGMANTRMKDFFDIRVLIREGALDAKVLSKAIAATFNRRGTALPVDMGKALSDEFANDDGKQAQWKAFLSRNRIEAPSLKEVMTEIRGTLKDALHGANRKAYGQKAGQF